MVVMALESQSAKQLPTAAPRFSCGNRLPRWLFLRCLGIVYFVAFTSFWVQAMGLIGSDGIAPADVFVRTIQETLTERPDLSPWQWPTLFWFLAPADDTIHIFCLAGTVLSVGLILGFIPRLVLLGLWVIYLSIFNVSSPFLGYQWDILLLEVTVVAFFYAPGGLRPSIAQEREPSRVSIWLFRLLIFKLIISSGLVKLNSGDASWQDLTALDYHFWTQPIPHQLAWHAHNAGAFFRQAGTLLNHFAELCVPWLILFPVWRYLVLPWCLLTFGILWFHTGELSVSLVVTIGFITMAFAWLPHWGTRFLGWQPESGRVARAAAAIFIIVLMLNVGLTGNYGFFNLLTCALVLPCLDDRSIYRFTPSRFLPKWPAEHGGPPSRTWLLVVTGAALVLIPLNGIRLAQVFGHDQIRSAQSVDRAQSVTPKARSLKGTVPPLTSWQSLWLKIPTFHRSVQEYVGGFALVNGYGLFARMTKERYELLVEGSYDGKNWKGIQFKYKPNEPDELAFAWLHMPRLDWQMWFAALYPKCSRRWFFGFLQALSEGSPSVNGLLRENPFSDKPPKFLRVRRVLAEFTSGEERDKTSNIWVFKPVRDYCPVLSKTRLKGVEARRHHKPPPRRSVPARR